MYDLEILVPAESKLAQRFIDFKKWGLRNIGNYKIKLVLAAAVDSDTKTLENGWPDGVDVEVVSTPYKHVAQRIYYYYDSIAKPDTAKWYYRVDEDSMNDIGRLMKNLESLFDHEREYHITGDLNWDVQAIERNILNKLGFDYWYQHQEDSPPHEYEVSITSNAAMKRILNEESAKQYFNLRKEIADGFGDHGLCFCARMVKIHPTTVKFLTVRPELAKFSEFGGHFNHIHWVSRDRNPCIMNWLDSMTKNQETSFKNVSFIWSLLNNNNKNNKKLIQLNPNNNIEEISIVDNKKKSVGLWSTTIDGNLTFFIDGDLAQNNPLVVFESTNGENGNVTIYNCRNYQLKTGILSALLAF